MNAKCRTRSGTDHAAPEHFRSLLPPPAARSPAGQPIRPRWKPPRVRMPIVRRRLLNLLTALSLLLCVAVCVLWVRSYRTYDFVLLYESRAPSGEAFGWAYSSGGKLILHWETIGGDSRRKKLPMWSAVRASKNGGVASRWSKVDSARHAIGFWLVSERHRYSGLPPVQSRYLAVPYWFLAAATAAPPVGWIIRKTRTRRRLATTRCLNCGYDLRATPARCPECGKEAPPARGRPPGPAPA